MAQMRHISGGPRHKQHFISSGAVNPATAPPSGRDHLPYENLCAKGCIYRAWLLGARVSGGQGVKRLHPTLAKPCWLLFQMVRRSSLPREEELTCCRMARWTTHCLARALQAAQREVLCHQRCVLSYLILCERYGLYAVSKLF